MRHNEVVQKLQSNFSTTKNLKESGIPWLGKIPEHWNTCRLDNVTSFINGYAFDSSEFCFDKPISVIRISDIHENGIDYKHCLKVEEKDELKHFAVKFGDILLALSGSIGKMCVYTSHEKAYINQRIAIIRSENSLVKYFLLSKGFGDYLFLVCSGTAQLNISTKDLGNFRIPLPPLQEQKAIADFLDKKTHQIEEFIAKKQKLITLLEEKKQTLINQCVTQGLDSSISLKDSGVEWLGKIPTHWEVLQLKFLGKLRGGDGFPHEYQGKNNYEFPFYKVGDLQKSKDGFFMSETENTISEEIGNIIRAKPFPKNTIVWAKIGEALCLNRRRVLKHVSYIDNNMTGFVIKQNVDLRYAFYLLSSVDLSLFINPSVVPSISEGTQALIRVPLPPLEEQKAIAEYLDTQIAKIDLAISKIKSQINLIKEYKSTLISEAVCGRVGIT